MSELRKDPVLRRWIIIAKERARRPRDFKTKPIPKTENNFCPFCEGNEDKTPPEIFACRKKGTKRDTPGWSVRVVYNKFPALKRKGELEKEGIGVYDMMKGIGAHEVIIETPKHKESLSQVALSSVKDVVFAYRERLLELKKDSRFVYGMIFKNVGYEAGASLDHTHSQIIATPIVPKLVWEEMQGSKDFYGFRGRCIFCDMIKEEIHLKERLLSDNKYFTTFCPFASRFPFEVWIVPKRHISHFEDLEDDEVTGLAKELKVTLSRLEKALPGLAYNYVVHTSPFDVVRLEYYHWHIEILPRLTRVAGFERGTGFYINPVPPEHAREFLKKANHELGVI